MKIGKRKAESAKVIRRDARVIRGKTYVIESGTATISPKNLKALMRHAAEALRATVGGAK